MITDILPWGGSWPPEKQAVIRSVGRTARFLLSNRSAMIAVAVTGVGAVALAYFTVGYVRYARLISDERAAAIRAEGANAELQDELAKIRDRLGATQARLATVSDEARARAQQRTEIERKLVATEEAASNKGDRVSQLTHALEQIQRELHQTGAQRATLMARLSKAESDLAEEQSRKSQAQATLDQWQQRLQQLAAERDKTARERDELRARVSRLEKQGALRTPAPPAPKPVAGPAPVEPTAVPAPSAIAAASPPPAQAQPPAVHPQPQAQILQGQAAAAVAPRGRIGEFERVLSSAGVDVARLFSQFGVTRGEGGPFVPAARGQVPPSTLTPEKMAALRALVKTLPLAAPLDHYDVGSAFGARHDPMNGRASFHTGADFNAPYMTPVYGTAAGTITYAGYRSDYGRVVEIDHGNGISTRYAHLHRYTVSVGQRIGARTQIGFLGSTGRATGPHVHYEVLVNGEPQDPTKFLRLGHIVPVAQR